MKTILLLIIICVVIYYTIVTCIIFMLRKQRAKPVASPETKNFEIIGQTKPYKEFLTVKSLESDQNTGNEIAEPTFVTFDTKEYSPESIEMEEDYESTTYMATGVTFDEIQFALDVIKTKDEEKDEEKEKDAGEILSRMLNTEMFESIVKQMPGHEQKIRNLIDNYISDDYEQFQIEDYL